MRFSWRLCLRRRTKEPRDKRQEMIDVGREIRVTWANLGGVSNMERTLDYWLAGVLYTASWHRKSDCSSVNPAKRNRSRPKVTAWDTDKGKEFGYRQPISSLFCYGPLQPLLVLWRRVCGKISEIRLICRTQRMFLSWFSLLGDTTKKKPSHAVVQRRSIITSFILLLINDLRTWTWKDEITGAG